MLSADTERADDARTRVERARFESTLVICPIVYAEVASQFAHPKAVDRFLADHTISIERSDTVTLYTAAVAWRSYAGRRKHGFACQFCGTQTELPCGACGRAMSARQHVVADFLVGAHALLQTDQLLTRDNRGYYRTYFPDLKLI